MQANQTIPEQTGEVGKVEDAACDACGRFGAFHIGDRTLCEDCYAGCGSCCPEFGKDDLWVFVNND